MFCAKRLACRNDSARRLRKATALAAVAALGTAAPLLAVNKTFVGPGLGDWNTSSNWSPVGVPAAGDNVIFQPTSGLPSYIYDGIYSAASPLGTLTVGNGSSSVPNLSQASDATLNVGSEFLDSGAWFQSGGLNAPNNLIVGNLANGQATYNLSGGPSRPAPATSSSGAPARERFRRPAAPSPPPARPSARSAMAPSSKTAVLAVLAP